MSKAHIVLFKIDCHSLISMLIGLVTRSKYSHTGVLLESGVMVDASETRGGVNYGKPLNEYGKRAVTVYEVDLPIETIQFIHDAIGNAKYDYRGVLLWVFNRQDPAKVTCIEFVIEVLASCGLAKIPSGRADFSNILDALHDPVYEGEACQY